ncbi:MAG: TolC family protein, partial [Anaerolineae bacterium]|nr:TolC family protein [Anaerolineae bacterium]
AVGGLLSVSLNASRFATNSAQFLLNPVFQSALTVTYDQSLLRNFGYDVNQTGIRIAQRNRSISESQFRQAVIDTLQNVEKAYWDLKFALEDLKVKRHSLRLSQETLSQNKIRVDVGTMAPIDVTTAEAEVASRRQDVLLAENALENARDLLLLYLNQPKTSPLWLLPVNPVDEPSFDDQMQIDLEGAIAEAYDNRPDLEQTQYLLDNDEDLVMQARDAMRWDLTARAQYGKVGLTGRRPEVISQARPQIVVDSYNPNNPNDPNDFTLQVVEVTTPGAPALDEDLVDAIKQNFDEDYDNWLLSLNLSIPLGNKQAKANYLTTRLRQEQRRELLNSQELDAVIQVRNAARAVVNTIERVKASQVNVRLQRER